MSNQTGFRQGRLGIGKNPIFPLDISGSTRIEGDLILGGTIADINGTPIEFGASSATLNVGTNMPIPEMTVSQVPSWEDSVTIEGAGKFVDAASAGDIYYNGGNIGIGTDTPTSNLHIKNDTNITSGGSVITGYANGPAECLRLQGKNVKAPPPPPYDVASSGSTLNGQTYSGYNGVNVDTNFDNTANSSWSNGFVKEGTTYDTNQTSTGYWMQVDIGQTIALKKYQIHNTGNTSYHHRNAKTWKLLYSNDGSTWSLASAVTDHTDWSVTSTLTSSAVMHEVELTEHKLGRYWRLSVEAINGTDNTWHQRELFLLGITEEEFNGEPNPYDLASSNSTLNGQTYTASGTMGGYNKDDAFDGTFTGTSSSWITNQKYPNGTYTGSESTNGYTGEWIQVDIGQSVVLKRVNVHPRTAGEQHDPKNMRFFGSSDGTTWVQIKDWAGLTKANNWRPTGGPWTAVGADTFFIGRYFRLVINASIASPSYSDYSQIGELELKGILESENQAPTGTGSLLRFTNAHFDPNDGEYNLSAIAGYQGKAGGELAFYTAPASSDIVAKMVIDTAGNVGIGTTTPGDKLEVNGNINFTGTLKQNGVEFGGGKFEDSATAGDIYYNGGNIGIGTTSPGEKLEVNGKAKISSNVAIGHTNSPITRLDIRENGGPRLRLENTSGGYSAQNGAIEFCTTYATTGFIHQKGEQLRIGTTGSSGEIRFYTYNNTGYPDQNGNTQTQSFFNETYTSGNDNPRMVIDETGNVGIGTTSPNYKLSLGEGGSSFAIFEQVSSGNYFYGFKAADVNGWGLNFLTSTGDDSDSNIRMCIKRDTGNVGIGTTDPDTKLHLGSGAIKVTNSTSLFLTMDYNQISVTGGDLFLNYTTQNDVIICGQGGNVGIGTTSPDTPLEIEASSSQFYGNLKCIHTNGSEWITMGYGGISTGTTHSLRFGVNGSEKMRIDNDGNVGIGIAAPATILHLYDTSPILTIETTQGDVDGRYGYIEWKDSGGAYAWVGDGSGSNKTFYIYTYGDPINLETNGGNVGIGTATPYMPFDCVISKYISDADIDQYWDRGIDDGSFFRTENDSFGSGYNYNSNQGRSGDLNDETDGSRPVNLKPISAHFYDNVYISNGGLLVSSDERIKQNIMEISDDISLKILRDISCCSYYYIDDIGRQKTPTLGFIAQQVNKIFPEAVTLTERIIPNVMKRINNFNWVSENSNNTHKLISDLQDVSGVLYRFYVSNNVDEREKRVEHIGNSDNTFTFENKWEHVFCYGYEVPDFHALDKQKLYALNFSATQELDKQQKLDKADIAELKTKNTELENKVTTLEFELAAIKQHLGI
ncbi:MAG: hypothetical protein CMD18_00015 [Flavobacteriales bacterium]|nr:hypothetical protein [Paracoccaceae bacterium]MAW64560.1 hypothetical protein [Flavobacteriales bacterium]|tara:strand:+ start:2763 stop:6734 length:3972 start_codon:yes stop_codon:yes gene_type:complete